MFPLIFKNLKKIVAWAQSYWDASFLSQIGTPFALNLNFILNNQCFWFTSWSIWNCQIKKRPLNLSTKLNPYASNIECFIKKKKHKFDISLRNIFNNTILIYLLSNFYAQNSSFALNKIQKTKFPFKQKWSWSKCHPHCVKRRRKLLEPILRKLKSCKIPSLFHMKIVTANVTKRPGLCYLHT